MVVKIFFTRSKNAPGESRAGLHTDTGYCTSCHSCGICQCILRAQRHASVIPRIYVKRHRLARQEVLLPVVKVDNITHLLTGSVHVPAKRKP